MIARLARLPCAALILVLQTPVASAAADREPGHSAQPAHSVVLRISEEMLNSLMGNKNIDRHSQVRDVIKGTSIYGSSRAIGQPGVELVESPDQGTFYITLVGTAYSRTKGYNGPVIVHSRGVTTFSATKLVVYQPGKGFYGLPPKVTARTQVFVEGIDSTRGGLIGRIIRRRATKIEAAQHAETTEIARQKAQRRIAQAFEKSSEERLARLNRMADLRMLVASALWASGSEAKYACCTTPDYLQFASNLGGSTKPIAVPSEILADAKNAPMEIWVHESLIGNWIAAAIDLLTAQRKVNDLLQVIIEAAKAGPSGQELSNRLPSDIGEQSLRIHKAGEWRVIQSGVATSKSKTGPPEPKRPSNAPSVARTPAPSSPSPPARSPGLRIWTSGNYTANAEFLALEGNIVRLRRNTGINTSISLEKLSATDRKWIAAHLAAQ